MESNGLYYISFNIPRIHINIKYIIIHFIVMSYFSSDRSLH
jgi:hypothetical protein